MIIRLEVDLRSRVSMIDKSLKFILYAQEG